MEVDIPLWLGSLWLRLASLRLGIRGQNGEIKRHRGRNGPVSHPALFPPFAENIQLSG
jgi:hypothetical protein